MRIKHYVGPFMQWKIKQGSAEHTMVEYRRFLKETVLPVIGQKRIKDLKITDKESVMELGRKHGYWGEQRAVSTLMCFLRWIRNDGHILPFRLEEMTIPVVLDRDQDFFTPEEYQQFTDRITLDFYGTRDRCLYELLWTTGLRIGEALKINWQDISFKDKEIKIQTFKGGEGEKVYICDSLEYWLKKWQEVRKDFDEAVFITYHNNIKRLTRGMSGKRLLDYRREFGITKKFSHKAFRAGHGTYLMNRGATIKEVQVLLRHRSPQTTLRYYLKWTKTQVKDTHRRIFGSFLLKQKYIFPKIRGVDNLYKYEEKL